MGRDLAVRYQFGSRYIAEGPKLTLGTGCLSIRRIEPCRARPVYDGFPWPVSGLATAGAHYLAVSRTRVLRRDERLTTVVRCIAMLHLGNGEMRCAEIDIDEQEFLALDTVEELGQAAGIIREFSAAPVLKAQC